MMKNKKQSINPIVLFGLLLLVFIVFFSVIHSRDSLLNSIKSNRQSKAREELFIGKTFLSKTFNTRTQLSFYLRTKIRQTIDKLPKMDIRDSIDSKFKKLLSDKIPGLSWHYFEYITPADYTNSQASLNSIVLNLF